MGISKTIGGERLRTGNGMKQSIHGFERSNHDISKVWRGSTTVGTLLPFDRKISLLKQTTDIDITTLVKTVPTLGPIMGSFKMQIDYFLAPIRLYNRQMHNDPLLIGRNPEKILFPQIQITAENYNPEKKGNVNLLQVHPTSLMYNLGVKGLGRNTDTPGGTVSRNFMGMFNLMYPDVYKTYYANKQEGEGVVIMPNVESDGVILTSIQVVDGQGRAIISMVQNGWYGRDGGNRNNYPVTLPRKCTLVAYGNSQGLDGTQVFIAPTTGPEIFPWSEATSGWEAYGETGIIYRDVILSDAESVIGGIGTTQTGQTGQYISPILMRFPLSNIDDMRDAILSAPKDEPYVINENAALPYGAPLKTVIGAGGQNVAGTAYPMTGLLVKTYLSDRFNNWLDNEFITGAGGIKDLTSIDTSSGSFSMDDFNLMSKLYKALSRLAIGDGSLHDYYEITVGESVQRTVESPIFVGGLSAEIRFDDIVSTAETGEENPLGRLAGRGGDSMHKGGKIRIKTPNEPCLIMGILSITPRVDYCQGNQWELGLENLRDLHDPNLDAIGYQDLTTDEFAAFDTQIADDGSVSKKGIGKQTAWIQYMTDVNEVSGTFAIPGNTMFMTNVRLYEQNDDGSLRDGTTYIDPTKYNQCFADASLSAQNFWVQIGLKKTARMKMSYKQIPNL